MVSVEVLNYLHKKGFRNSLARFCSLVYLLKGFGPVPSHFHETLRSYSFKVNGILYLTMGPGWAISYDYLKRLLVATYNHYYMPEPGDCVIDIGAGVGEEVSIYSQLVGPSGKVHALEANPTSFAALKFMCEQNKFDQTRAHHLAIYNLDGQVTIEDDIENYLVNTINKVAPQTAGIPVKATTLDSFVKHQGIDRIDFLKSNVEGAEQYLIEGMTNSVSIIRNFCISCHDFRHIYHNHGEFYMTKSRVMEFFRDHGFRLTVRNTGNRVVDDYIYGSSQRKT